MFLLFFFMYTDAHMHTYTRIKNTQTTVLNVFLLHWQSLFEYQLPLKGLSYDAIQVRTYVHVTTETFLVRRKQPTSTKLRKGTVLWFCMKQSDEFHSYKTTTKNRFLFVTVIATQTVEYWDIVIFCDNVSITQNYKDVPIRVCSHTQFHQEVKI